jgi:flagellar hook-associated protein 3 FlgL
MRISDNSIVADFLASLNHSRARINRLNRQLSTQKRILRVSDDPDGAGAILRLNSDLQRVASYKEGVASGKSSLKMTADSLGRVSDLLQEVKGVLTGATGSADPSLLNKFADQVDQFLNLGLEIANTQFDRKYIFGGTNTTTPPFVRTGTPAQVVYRGDAGALSYQVGNGASQVVNVNGLAAFGSTGEISFNGILDRNAAVNTTVSNTMQVTDGSGVSHDVVITMRKIDANSWAMSAALPPGSTGATLSGGTATISFDPVTGIPTETLRGTPLVLTPLASPPAQAAPALTMMVRAGTLAEEATGGGPSTFTGTQKSISVFNKLLELRDTLQNGKQPTADDMAFIGIMQDVVMREEARAGSLSESLTAADTYLTAHREHLLDLLGDKQDVNLAEIGMKLSQEQVMLDAALSAAARVIPKTLLDFLK